MVKNWTAAAAAFLAATGMAMADTAPPPGSQTVTTDIVVAQDGTAVETIHTERFANNEAGAMGAGRVTIPYNAGMQDITIVEAYTLKPDGVRIPVDPTSIQEQLQRDGGAYSTYADLRNKVLEFPQFMTGDTIVYTVKRTTRPYFTGKYTHRDFYLQSSITRNETITISMPKAMPLKTDVHDVEMTTREDGGRRIYTFHYAPKPAAPTTTSALSLLTSALSGTLADKLPHYAVSSFADYAELGRAEAGLIEPKIVVDDKVKALAERILAGETSRREKAKKLYEWVVKNVRYVAIELGRGSLEPHDADWVIANGYGDCKDHDLLLRTLLKAAGIDSQSALLNGTYTYTLSPAPSFSEINHIITYIPEFETYVDSSNAMAPFGVLSPNLYGKPAIRMSAKNASEITLPRPPASSVRTDVNETIGNDGSLTGTLKTVVSGPASLASRGTNLRLQTSSPDSATTSRLSGRSLKDPKGTSQADPATDLAAQHSVSATFTSAGWSDWLAGKVQSLLPGAATTLTGEAASGTTLMSSKSEETVSCASVHAIEHVALTLPDSYSKTPHLPDDTKVATDHVSFSAHWSYSGHTLTLDRDLKTDFPSARCTGAVKTEAAEALTRIRTSYANQISLDPTVTPRNTAADVETIKAAQEAFKKSNFTEVIRLLTDFLARPVNEQQASAAHLARGMAYFRQGQLNAAIDDLSVYLRLKPEGDIAAYETRSRAYLRTGRAKDALADLDVAIKRSPEDIMLRELHADTATAAGAFKEAVADYDVILKITPNAQRVLLMRATAHYGAHQYDDAAADYEAAGKLKGSDAPVLNGMCDALARSSRLGDALYQCSRALEISPLGGPQLEARGLVYYRQGKFAKALEDFAKAAETYPQAARYLYERGLTKKRLGVTESGEHDIARALAADPAVAAKLPEQMKP